MRKQHIKALITVGLLGVMSMFMAAASVQGQSLASKMKVNIPFDFIVGDRNLPAGRYSIGRAQALSDDFVLAISGVDSSANVFRLTTAVHSLKPKNKGMLVFHRLGDQYFLFQVWAAGSNTGRSIPKSRRESELERVAPGARRMPGGSIGPNETVFVQLR
jgi:hypothetical protein